MSKVTIELNSNGIVALLKSSEVEDEINAHADRIIGACSGSYEKVEYHGAKRNAIEVTTADKRTYYKNLNGNELLKALR